MPFPPITIHVHGPVTVNQCDSGPVLQAIAALSATEGAHMSELDDRIADLQAAEDTNTAKLATLIADFEAAGTLTDAQKTALDALKSEIVGNSAAIDAADPNAATPTV